MPQHSRKATWPSVVTTKCQDLSLEEGPCECVTFCIVASLCGVAVKVGVGVGGVGVCLCVCYVPVYVWVGHVKYLHVVNP